MYLIGLPANTLWEHRNEQSKKVQKNLTIVSNCRRVDRSKQIGTGTNRLALVFWAFARVEVHRLQYLSVFQFTLLHLPLNFICASSLRLMYLYPSVDPSLTHFFGKFPGFGLALVPDVVVPEAEQR